jgi:thiamine kinase-like enzyme
MRSDPEPESEVVGHNLSLKDDEEEDRSKTAPTDATELDKEDDREETGSEDFCGVEALLAAAVTSGALPITATKPELRRIVPLSAGFCNRVHRVHVTDPERDNTLDLVVKEFSALSRARSTSSAFATDRLSEAHGSPQQLFSCHHGVIHNFCEGKVELTEADVGTSGSRATVQSVARAVANLHCTPTSRLPPGIPPTPMVWVSVETMLRRLVQHTAAGKMPAAPASRTWNVHEVVQVCARERALIERAGYALVLGHGDLKPTNVLARRSRSQIDQDDGYSDAVLIDFELSGVNYRGFDLCKLFRNDAGAIDTSETGPLWSFLNEYRACCQKSAGAESAFMPSVDSLAAEAAALEPATWLEASVFFMTVLCEVGFSAEQYDVAERLSTHRWERYLQLRPEFKS